VDLGLEFWRVFWEKALKLKREEVTTNGQNIIKRDSEYLTRYYEADQIKKWEVQVAYMGEMRNKHKFRVENLKDNNHFGEAGISLKDLKTRDEIKWNDSLDSG
jgi:hypothetical protein